MDLETLQHLRSEYPGSSWALWSDDFPDDGCVEEDTDDLIEFIHANRNRLNDRVVLLSLNPSSIHPPGYQNFHSPASKHYDSRLKAFIQDNGLAQIIGAYMTDIAPEVVDSDSSNVTPETADADRFLEQLDALGNREYHVFCFSRQAFEVLQARFDAETTELPHDITSFTGSRAGLTAHVYRVWHYSNYGANADKVPELEQQLRYLNKEIIG